MVTKHRSPWTVAWHLCYPCEPYSESTVHEDCIGYFFFAQDPMLRASRALDSFWSILSRSKAAGRQALLTRKLHVRKESVCVS